MMTVDVWTCGDYVRRHWQFPQFLSSDGPTIISWRLCGSINHKPVFKHERSRKDGKVEAGKKEVFAASLIKKVLLLPFHSIQFSFVAGDEENSFFCQL
jgi:hypothetical protein